MVLIDVGASRYGGTNASISLAGDKDKMIGSLTAQAPM